LAKPLGSFTLYINRDCDYSRRCEMELQLDREGLAYERVTAVEGVQVPAELRPEFFSGDGLHGNLTPGEVGCYASHLQIWRSVVARNLASALVLEDDALLPPSFRTKVDELLRAAPPGWDFIHLSGDSKRAVKHIASAGEAGSLVKYSRIPAGTVAYLISRQGAQKLSAARARYWPVDTDIRRPWHYGLNVYGAMPFLVSHNESIASTIGSLKERSRGRRGMHLPSRASWTGNPFHCPEAVYFNMAALGPSAWMRCLTLNSYARAARIFPRPQVSQRLAQTS
jgi:glycosyl transferase family 25